MRTVEQLKARRAILVGALERVRKGWARGMLAKDRNGDRVEPNDPSAVCWCAAGALLASGGLRGSTDSAIWDSYRMIWQWNDAGGHQQDDVIAAFEAAIQQTDDEIAARSAP